MMLTKLRSAFVLVLLGAGFFFACGSEISDRGEDDGDDGASGAGVDAGSSEERTGGKDAGETGKDAGETGKDAGVGDGGSLDDASSEGGAGGSLLCGSHQWQSPVPAAGTEIMAVGSKAYLFGSDGVSWTVVEGGASTTAPIPLPPGIDAMKSVVTEMAPSKRPFVTFTNKGVRYGTFFNGSTFEKLTELGDPGAWVLRDLAHADAQERMYVKTLAGLVEIVPGSPPAARGAFPHVPKAWTVAADGTVVLLRATTNASTGWFELRSLRLPHGSSTWGDDTLIVTNQDYPYGFMALAAAPDGSLHGVALPWYFRSTDGASWTHEAIIGPLAKATMIDPAPVVGDYDPATPTGIPYLVAAQSYASVSATLTFNGGSASAPSYYFLRRCSPIDPQEGWHAERLSLSSPVAYAPTPVAVNQRGLASILTLDGVRQDTP